MYVQCLYGRGATDVGRVDIMLNYDAGVKAVSVEISDLGKKPFGANLCKPGQVNIALVDASGINGEGEIATTLLCAG